MLRDKCLSNQSWKLTVFVLSGCPMNINATFLKVRLSTSFICDDLKQTGHFVSLEVFSIVNRTDKSFDLLICESPLNQMNRPNPNSLFPWFSSSPSLYFYIHSCSSEAFSLAFHVYSLSAGLLCCLLSSTEYFFLRCPLSCTFICSWYHVVLDSTFIISHNISYLPHTEDDSSLSRNV